MSLPLPAGGDGAAPVDLTGRAAAAPGRPSRVTPMMIMTALASVLLTVMLVDVLIAGLIWILLEIAGVPPSWIGWIVGALVAATLAPAVLLFRHALASERELAGPTGGRTG